MKRDSKQREQQVKSHVHYCPKNKEEDQMAEMDYKQEMK